MGRKDECACHRHELAHWMQCAFSVRGPGRMTQACVKRLMSVWDTLDPETRSSKKIKTTSLVDSVPGALDALNKHNAHTASSELARAGGSREALRADSSADNDLRRGNHESTGRPAEQCRLKGNARRAAVTALSVHKFDGVAAAPVPFFFGGPDSSEFFKDSRELIALVCAYVGYTKPAAASSSVASEGDGDLDDEESQEPEGESDHLPE
ncbi:hypothetical protein T492DRAFT_843133 [Pavlovales sp. CCMP2436]|nr:hypothetical protein T492DRAFT_843133 [Pavlovales sp. CCMP2436]